MSAEQGAPVENSDNIDANTIIKTIQAVNEKVNQATATAKANLEKLQKLLEKSGIDARQQTEQITKLEGEIAELNRSNTSLSEKAARLTEINQEIKNLDENINVLIENNEEINKALEPSNEQSGGFQYNKKHSKHKRPFRLFSRSNSKTTSKKSKKRRRRPGKSVKKGGMKTRRRRNKKSKKSKKRRK